MRSVLTDAVVHALEDLSATRSPVVVAVSGFGGSGKSTLAGDIAARLGDVNVVPIDDFAIGRLAARTPDWSSFDRARLAAQVLRPAAAGEPVRYQRYDWVDDRPGEWVDLPPRAYLVIEGISTLHPDLLPYLDHSIWLDVPLEVAVERGVRRDRERGNDHDALWGEVWGPNDDDYFRRYRPDRSASVVLPGWLDD